MKNAGIIAEYNPFHKGHLWQIDELRRRGAETITILMGGDFSQRGRPAAFSKFTRAEAALRCGADLVIELPLPWAAASAPDFAFGGIYLLHALGCVDTLSFGAEQASPEWLYDLATLLARPDFDEALKAELALGGSYPAARATVAERFLPGSAALLATPNNILGIAYLRAAAALGWSPELACLPRQGAAHDAPAAANGFASASALRKALFADDLATLRNYVPSTAFELYCADLATGAVYSEDAFSRSLLTVLRTADSAQFAHCPSAGGEGLAHLLASSAHKAATAEELYTQLKSKRYTHARVRRLALEAYLGIGNTLPATPPFLRVLGASEAGIGLLRQAKTAATLPIAFSLADAGRLSPEAERIAALTARGDALYGLCLAQPRASGDDYSRKFLRV